EDVVVHAGDTNAAPTNTGGFASRTVIAAAGAIERGAQEFTDRVRRLGSNALRTDADAVELVDGAVRVIDEPDRSISLRSIFRMAILGERLPPGESPGLEVTSYFSPSHAAYAFGTAAAVVNVDAETGEFEVERIVMVHDSGVAINPMLVEGQVVGGIVQALGAAVGEELVYDEETGQLLNGTMMDYFAPLAPDIPRIQVISTEVPSPVTPLGVRGAGESGTIPVAAALANAICNALDEFAVELDRLPITPEQVWRAVQAARAL
ncbi:MAG TPA: molybdopterin cofactor-binding domain-containing protein, partial [Acidimicrobiales bacterium]|nr:molybdopterin cofactor-binding domain-containing protein [Acidimicrobiales bacterium]